PPVVACAGDDDDTRVDRMRDRYAQRVFAPRLAHRRAKAHVDDVDAIAITILDRPVDGAQHTARRARTMLVERAQVNDVRVRRNAAIVRAVAVRASAATGRNA